MSTSGTSFGGGKSLFGTEGSEEVVVDLNLTPLMDVMSNILFFLLASFGAAIVSFLGATIPVQTDGEAATPPADQVTVSLQVTAEGYKLTPQNEEVSSDKLERFAKTLKKKKGKYDTEGLTAALFAVKKEFPRSDTLVVVPSKATVYEEIIEVMDAARLTRLPDGKQLRLFPKVVVADLVDEE